MKQIYIVRHGQSTTNAGGEVFPNAQIPITKLGEKQAHEVAEWLIKETQGQITSVGVSKFIRTQQTSAPFLALLNENSQKPLQATIIEGMQEFDFQNYEKVKGKSLKYRVEHAEEFFKTAEPTSTDGGDTESFADLSRRVANVLEQFHQLQAGNHVMYTHGVWISMLCWQLLGQPTDSNTAMQKFRQFELALRPTNCEVFLLTLKDGQPPAFTKVRTVSKVLKQKKSIFGLFKKS